MIPIGSRMKVIGCYFAAGGQRSCKIPIKTNSIMARATRKSVKAKTNTQDKIGKGKRDNLTDSRDPSVVQGKSKKKEGAQGILSTKGGGEAQGASDTSTAQGL